MLRVLIRVLKLCASKLGIVYAKISKSLELLLVGCRNSDFGFFVSVPFCCRSITCTQILKKKL